MNQTQQEQTLFCLEESEKRWEEIGRGRKISYHSHRERFHICPEEGPTYGATLFDQTKQKSDKFQT